MLNIKRIKTNGHGILDLTNNTPLTVPDFSVEPPSDDPAAGSHPLIHASTSRMYNFANGGRYWQMEFEKNPYFQFSFFMPTTGWSCIDEDGNFVNNYKFRDQQIEFLIGIFEHWNHFKDYKLVIDFCDESPDLNDCLEQIYELLRLYEIPINKFILCGHNFLGQQTVNTYADTIKMPPIKYIVKWDMAGHMNHNDIENLLVRHPFDGKEVKLEFVDLNEWDTVRKHSMTFLNRRQCYPRVVLLWLLYINGIHSTRALISAFPPLRYFGFSTGVAASPERIVGYQQLREYIRLYVPSKLVTVTEDSWRDFLDKMKIGQSLDNDHEFIGDIESKHIPERTNSYIWLTSETVAEMKLPNLFFTEKVLKPMVNGQALLCYSQKDFIKNFKKLGFHTLAEEFGINESYDDEPDDEKRFLLLADEVIKMSRIPQIELHERWKSAKNKIIENQVRTACFLKNIRNNHAANIAMYVTDNIIEDYNLDNILKSTPDEILKFYNTTFKLDKIEIPRK